MGVNYRMKIIDGLIHDTIGFTCSCFDLLHAGHIIMLQYAKVRCDKLIVGLQYDPSVDRPEKNKPIQSYEERRIQLEAVKYVDEVITYNTEKDLYELLKKLNPDVRILGDDYKGKSFTGDDLDIKIYYHDRNHNYSTTNLREKIEEQMVSYKSVRSVH
jgi:glycerol-3-phosphate cytidylyltransferase